MSWLTDADPTLSKHIKGLHGFVLVVEIVMPKAMLYDALVQQPEQISLPVDQSALNERGSVVIQITSCWGRPVIINWHNITNTQRYYSDKKNFVDFPFNSLLLETKLRHKGQNLSRARDAKFRCSNSFIQVPDSDFILSHKGLDHQINRLHVFKDIICFCNTQW